MIAIILFHFITHGQIWKIDAHTGKILWKFGKGGTVSMPAECDFTQAHAVHINQHGSLMFFDNGVEKIQSEVFAVRIDAEKMKASPDLHFKLPEDIYNDRMGSAYMVNDTSILVCCSKRNITVLANRKGVFACGHSKPQYRLTGWNFWRAKNWSRY